MDFEKLYDEYIELVLDQADEYSNNPNAKYYIHEEIFSKIKKLLEK